MAAVENRLTDGNATPANGPIASNGSPILSASKLIAFAPLPNGMAAWRHFHQAGRFPYTCRSPLFSTRCGRKPRMKYVESASNHRSSWLALSRATPPLPDVMAAADLCLAGSGTVTLEAAVMGTPMVVMAAVSRLTYALAKPFVDAPYIGLPNVIAGREVVPELVQRDATPERLAATAADLLEHPEKAARIREDLARVKAALGQGGASRRAAEAVSRRLWQEKKDTG